MFLSAFTTPDASLEAEGHARPTTARHVLLVEDYPGNVLVATTLLEVIGYSYEVASTGEEALARLKEGTFDCVLMDVKMPGIDGLTATQLLRNWEKETGRAPVTVIGMTAYALVGDKQRCLDAGMNAYISKPFSKNDLEEKLAFFLA